MHTVLITGFIGQTLVHARGIRSTVQWSLDHESWRRDITNDAYRTWIDRNHGFRSAV